MRKILYILLLVMLNLFQHLCAQNNPSTGPGHSKIDSLLNLLKTDAADTNKAIHSYKLCWQYMNIGNYDTALILGKQALALSQKLSFNKGIAISYNNIGIVYNRQGNYPEALKNYFASLKIEEEIGDKKGIANSYNNIGNVYYRQGNYPEALKNYFASLKIQEQIGDKKGIATSYGNIGTVYDSQGNYPEALKNYFASLKIEEEIGDKQGIAISYNNIGNVYADHGNFPDALKNYFAALKIREQIGDKQGIATSYGNIGIVYYMQGNYPEALKNYFASLKIYEQIGDKEGIATSYINLGQLYTKLATQPRTVISSEVEKSKSSPHASTPLSMTKEAQRYLDSALILSQEIGSNDAIKDSYAGLAVLDSLIAVSSSGQLAVNKWKEAFAHHKLYIIYRDSLNNEETKKKSLQSAMQYEFDKKEIAAKAEQDKLDAINAEEKQKQRIVIYAVAGLLVLVVVFAVFMFNRFRITNRQKHIIELQKQKVDEAYTKLEEKNKEVMDSIHYAKRIQTALITSEKYINNALNRLMKH